MKVPVFILFLLSVVVFSCKKDKYTTEPQVTVKSISPGEVSLGNILTIDAKFTDDEGDIDSVLMVLKYYDGDIVTLTDTSRFSLETLNLPSKVRQGDMSVQFDYGTNNSGYPILPFSPVPKDTTSTFGLLIIDKASHRSNYSESGKVRLKS
jgi:hypothetical protein